MLHPISIETALSYAQYPQQLQLSCLENRWEIAALEVSMRPHTFSCPSEVTCIDFFHDTWMAIGCASGHLEVRKNDTSFATSVMHGRIDEIAFLGRPWELAVKVDGLFHIWSLYENELVPHFGVTGINNSTKLSDFVISPQQDWAVLYHEKKLVCCDLKKKRITRVVRTTESNPMLLTFSPHGTLVIVHGLKVTLGNDLRQLGKTVHLRRTIHKIGCLTSSLNCCGLGIYYAIGVAISSQVSPPVALAIFASNMCCAYASCCILPILNHQLIRPYTGELRDIYKEVNQRLPDTKIWIPICC